jgi:hypothetical protein
VQQPQVDALGIRTTQCLKVASRPAVFIPSKLDFSVPRSGYDLFRTVAG